MFAIKKYVFLSCLISFSLSVSAQDCKVSDWDLLFMIGKKVQRVISQTQTVGLEEELALGKDAYQKLDKVYSLRQKGKDYRKLNDIFKKLVHQCERKDINYQLFIIDDDTTVNAFSHAAGYVYVTTGLLLQLRNDDETALILGHELSHIDKKHCLNTHQLQKIKQKLPDDAAKSAVDLLKNVIAPFDQFDEYDADWTSAELCVKAGYDVQKGMEVFKRWALFEQTDENMKLFRTHPFSKDRVCFLVQYMKVYHPQNQEVKAVK